MTKEHHQLALAFLPLVILYTINWIADTLFYLYYFFPNADIPMHFFGGLLAARFLFALWCAYGKKFRMVIEPRGLLIAVHVGMVGVIAFLWEAYEHLHDFVFGTVYQRGASDLLFDMFLGMVGAWFFALFFLPKKARRRVVRKKKRG